MISVVMPAYNSEKYIDKAIESILNQTYPDFELVVVDDGSTDRTAEIIKSYIRKDPRVRLVAGAHQGVSEARNKGVEASRYDWIAVMDSDDIALPTRLDKQLNAARNNPNVIAWGTYIHHINSEGKILSLNSLGPLNEAEFYRAYNAGCPINLHHPTVIYRKEIFIKVGGYDTKYKAAHDFELLDRMGVYGPLLAIPEPLLLYRLHSQSISMNRFFLQKDVIRYVVARHQARLAEKPELSFEEFLEQKHQTPWLQKVKTSTRTNGQFMYRKAGVYYAEQHYLKAVFYLGLSAFLNPGYSLPRVWKQFLSGKTRKVISRSKEV
ncbi:MAG: glycosyltransferase family 2 protein [Microcoleaceae cyanobacterium]